MPGTELLPGESLTADERMLAKLGYKQELTRRWSRFSNFAISFSIVSVLAGRLRWRMGDRFQTGPWNLGRKYTWINLVAIIWVALNVIIFSLPATPTAVWFKSGFAWTAANYSPLVNLGVFLIVAIWWLVSAKNTFRGAVRTVDDAAVEGSGSPPPTSGAAPAIA